MTNDRSYLQGGTKRAGRPAAIFAAVVVLAIVLIGLFDRDRIYEWVKVLHVLAVISWMVGLLYLPRLFAYHADVAPESGESDMLRVMEGRLIKVIMGPAMMISWLSGFYLALIWYSSIWFLIKFLAVIGLTMFHVSLSKASKAFVRGDNSRTSKQWRMLNELPTVGLIIVVIMVIVKPF